MSYKSEVDLINEINTILSNINNKYDVEKKGGKLKKKKTQSNKNKEWWDNVKYVREYYGISHKEAVKLASQILKEQ